MSLLPLVPLLLLPLLPVAAETCTIACSAVKSSVISPVS